MIDLDKITFSLFFCMLVIAICLNVPTFILAYYFIRKLYRRMKAIEASEQALPTNVKSGLCLSCAQNCAVDMENTVLHFECDRDAPINWL